MIINSIVRVGKANFGDVFYDINLEVDSYLPRTINSVSDINESTSVNSISQNPEKSTPTSKHSLSPAENNADEIFTPANMSQSRVEMIRANSHR